MQDREVILKEEQKTKVKSTWRSKWSACKGNLFYENCNVGSEYHITLENQWRRYRGKRYWYLETCIRTCNRL